MRSLPNVPQAVRRKVSGCQRAGLRAIGTANPGARAGASACVTCPIVKLLICEKPLICVKSLMCDTPLICENAGPKCRRQRHARRVRIEGAGCRMQGWGLRVNGAGCRVQGAGFRAQGSGRRVQGTFHRLRGRAVPAPSMPFIWNQRQLLGTRRYPHPPSRAALPK